MSAQKQLVLLAKHRCHPLQLKQHADQSKSALILKQEVCEWGILNATKVTKQLECPPNTLLRNIRIAQRRVLLIVDEDSAICRGLLPLQHGVDNMMMWPLWCKSNHFTYGTQMVDCVAFPAMDALLGSDGEDAAPNKMQMIAGFETSMRASKVPGHGACPPW
eukprot:3597165-Amphidinium_carterae.1